MQNESHSNSSTALRVLAIDDDADTREMLEVLLGSLGWSVMVADSYAAALRLFEMSKPDLILSDIGLPDRDGFELIREIRRRSASRVPAVAVTGSGEERHTALDAGYDGFVTKPISLPALRAAITEILAR